jgi:hypothetical protein
MQLARPVGREAASRKYDILSALMAHALSQGPASQKQVLRLMSLITTRYNWQRDELSIGQTEIARLWCVDPRTVKRETAKLKARGWLVVKRQGSRGRVTVYGFDLARMLEDTRTAWPNIGPDFVTRLAGQQEPDASTNVVQFRSTPAPRPNGSLWSEVQTRLHAQDPATYAAWYQPLEEVEIAEGCLTLAAPTRFHASYVETHLKQRLLAAIAWADPTVRNLRITG